MTITLPNVNTECDHMFGELYLHSSCSGKCTNSPCPLAKIPKHDSCPEYYTNRARTMANNQRRAVRAFGRWLTP